MYPSNPEFDQQVPDKVNDAPALAQVVAETADIILVNSKPTDITNLVEFGKVTDRKMIQNLLWSMGYIVIAIQLAAGVLYPHFVLSPAIGEVLMSASTVILALSAQLLKRSMSGNRTTSNQPKLTPESGCIISSTQLYLIR